MCIRDRGWSAEDRRFSFACADKSMAYAYITNSSGDNYSLRGTRENENLGNAWAIVATALNLPFNGKVVLDSFCEAPIVSSNLTPKCGNNILEGNEVCDYSDKRYSGWSNCTVGTGGEYLGKVGTLICYNNCSSIVSIPEDCSEVAKRIPARCGDGKIQTNFGEKCDDGANNGRPGFCGTNCQPPTISATTCGNKEFNAGELCDWSISEFNKYCLSPISLKKCDSSVYFNSDGTNGSYCYPFGILVCSSSEQYAERWAPTKLGSCNSSCNGFGPYCGDGILQSRYGEQCEGEGTSCKIGAQNGICRQCRCDTTAQSTPSPEVPISCGDNKLQIENGEECDLGSDNGKVCEIPLGFSMCSWCSTDCKIKYNTCPAGTIWVTGGGCCAPGQRYIPPIFSAPGFCQPLL